MTDKPNDTPALLDYRELGVAIVYLEQIVAAANAERKQ